MIMVRDEGYAPGLRLEALRRQVLEMPDGSYADLGLFARLASDQWVEVMASPV